MAGLEAKDRENLTGLLDVARREVARLDQIINQFLRALRPTQPSFERASLREVVDSTLEFLKHEIRDRDILVEVESPEELPRALIDRIQIRQAFFNIVRNAIQAMPNGGILKIALSSNDRFVTASFADTGRGISAEDIGAIFEPYFTTKPDGSGLGLMIVQRIVRAHGGRMELESQVGRGTTFRVWLPLHERKPRLLEAPAHD
jgi:signal transduction histidine kinase